MLLRFCHLSSLVLPDVHARVSSHHHSLNDLATLVISTTNTTCTTQPWLRTASGGYKLLLVCSKTGQQARKAEVRRSIIDAPTRLPFHLKVLGRSGPAVLIAEALDFRHMLAEALLSSNRHRRSIILLPVRSVNTNSSNITKDRLQWAVPSALCSVKICLSNHV